jgi:putative nucleotide binding protein
MEEYAYILDFLPRGRPDNPRSKDPVAYAVGERNFVLLELVPRHDAVLVVGDRVYVGKEPALKDKIDHVRGRVRFEEMTHAGQSELRPVLEAVIKQEQQRFVQFFNEAGPITTRMHMLELLPGLGKKLMWAILDERKKGPFKTIEDLDTRVKALHHPVKLIAHRIEQEITDAHEKYHLFAQPFVERSDMGPPGRGPPRGGPPGRGMR